MRDLERRIARVEREVGQAVAARPLVVVMWYAGDTRETALARAVGPEGPPEDALIVTIYRDFPDDDRSSRR